LIGPSIPNESSDKAPAKLLKCGMNLTVILSCIGLILVAPIAAFALTRDEPVRGPILAWYFRVRAWESARGFALYRCAGARLFQRVLLFWYDRVFLLLQRIVGVHILGQPPLTAEQWRSINGQHIGRGSVRGSNLDVVRRSSMRFELIHAFILVPTLPIVIGVCADGHIAAGTMLAALTWLTNVWPILLQRYTRARVASFTEAAVRSPHAGCKTIFGVR
jgi:hypothetical protein